MILGNAGIVTAIASLIIGFADVSDRVHTWVKITILAGGISLLWILANSRWIDRQLSLIINRILKKQHNIDVNDYVSLLHLSGEYRISEIGIERDHWLCDKKLANTKLHDEGLNLLAISRKDGTFLGAPARNTRIQEGDSIIIYGRAEALSNLEKRLKGVEGNREHRQMTKEQKKVQKHEKEEDLQE
jgi:hypothetical protein